MNEKQQEKQHCGNCNFWHPDGECRKYVPQVITLRGIDMKTGAILNKAVTKCPQVAKDFCCGEWEPKVE